VTRVAAVTVAATTNIADADINIIAEKTAFRLGSKAYF